MPGRTPAATAAAFVGQLQRALSCVTPAVLGYAGGIFPPDHPYPIYLGNGDPVLLRGPSRLALTLRMQYRVVNVENERRLWRTQVAGYLYSFDDREGREVLAYHWHSDGRSSETEPHLHLGAGAQVGRREIARAHLPTGRIGVPELLRLAISALDVEPRREDWQSVLAETLAYTAREQGPNLTGNE